MSIFTGRPAQNARGAFEVYYFRHQPLDRFDGWRHGTTRNPALRHPNQQTHGSLHRRRCFVALSRIRRWVLPQEAIRRNGASLTHSSMEHRRPRKGGFEPLESYTSYIATYVYVEYVE